MCTGSANSREVWEELRKEALQKTNQLIIFISIIHRYISYSEDKLSDFSVQMQLNERHTATPNESGFRMREKLVVQSN